jgi:N utilization substance protein B
MAVVDRLIMRMAVYELLYTDTPAAVVIDEALELAKTFCGDQAVAFVNGILDGVSRELAGRDGRLTTDG